MHCASKAASAAPSPPILVCAPARRRCGAPIWRSTARRSSGRRAGPNTLCSSRRCFPASTQHVDQHAKLDEYKALESLQTILLLEPEQVDVGVWRRGSGGWMHHRLPDDLSAIVEAQGLGLSIALADIYRGVELRPRTGPKLIWPDDGDTLPKG